MGDAKKVEHSARELGEAKSSRSVEVAIGVDEALEAAFRNVQTRMKAMLGPNIYNSWIASLRAVKRDGGRVILAASSAYRRNHIAAQYQERLVFLWRQEDSSVSAVELIVDPSAQGATLATAPPKPPRPMSASPSSSGADPMRTSNKLRVRPQGKTFNFLADVEPDANLTFERFVVGPANRLAVAAAERVAKEPSGNYNPFYLYCPSGYGKTHLVSAIGREAMRVSPGLKIAYVPAEKFMMHYATSAREGETMMFREMIRAVDLLILDDLQFICGRGPTLREFNQTFNTLVAAGKRVIVTADRPPAKLEDVDDHIRSRLASGLTVTIEPADYDMRLAILRRKLVDRLTPDKRHYVPEASLEYIARKIETNPRELEAALKCVAANCELLNRPISLDTTAEFVSHLIRTQDRRITIEEIQKEVSTFYGVSMRDLLSHRRERQIVRPRQVAMYLAKELTTRSLPEIGRRFGGRDHTTVLYGVRKIGALKAKDTDLSDEIDLLKRIIEG